MFSRSSPSIPQDDEPNLEVTVTPIASAFYAGETFSAVISFRNNRRSGSRRTLAAQSVPTTPEPNHGLHWLPGTGLPSPASETESQTTTISPERAWSPASQTWREHARRPSGKGHTRRTQSLALGKGTLSPQEMVWALGGGSPSQPNSVPVSPTPPALPLRRGANIPRAHPHARQVSIASTVALANSPPPSAHLPLSAPLPEDSGSSELQDAQILRSPDLSIDTEAGPSRRGSSRPSPSPSPSLPDVMEESNHKNYPSTPDQRTTSRPPISPGGLYASTSSNDTFLRSSTSSFTSTSSAGGSDSPRENGRRLHSRAPSYHNSYGSSFLSPPPPHPSRKNQLPLDTGSTTILWAHTRLVARFSPSHQHIPPDPLLPLKSKLLHQPIGSGSLSQSDSSSRGSRWAINFGTGSLGKDAQPSLTGSLFGLAKGLVSGGAGGSLEEERKRVWNTQDLPVLETTRSLIGVDIRLAEGETREFVYTIQLPTNLPPAFKGRALRFSYELMVSLSISLPGSGRQQRTKEFNIPVRVWPNVSLSNPLRTYDVLQPIIQNTEHASVEERAVQAPTILASRRHTPHEPPQKKGDSLANYAKRLVDTLDDGNRVPPSPSKALKPLSPDQASPVSPLSPGLSPVSPNTISLNSPGFHSSFPKSPVKSGFLAAPEKIRPRASSLVAGDDELVEEAQRCGEAVEILSRHSPKSSYDIRKDGEIVAVLTLIKTTYRLGETVLGVVTFNDPDTDRRVLKISAFLETHEVIPEPLLPPSANSSGRVRQPDLRKVHAEHSSAYALHTARIPFSLDIPSDATPAFSLVAGDGKAGGLEWRVRLTFLVAVPPHRKSTDRRSMSSKTPTSQSPSRSTVIHLLPTDGDGDNAPYSASSSLVPIVRAGGDEWLEARTETVECEVPVSVLAGNTAFVVRPSVYAV